MTLNPHDLRIDTFSAGLGLGRISRVRVTHEPTGFSEECSEFPSQIQNREKAIGILLKRLASLALPPDCQPPE